MLTFDDRFVADRYGLGCVLWADGPEKRRVRFNIGSSVLTDVLHGGNPVHDEQNVELCARERLRIEAACRHAFTARPHVTIDLTATDFLAA